MATLLNLEQWQLDKQVSSTSRYAYLKIFFKYPDQKTLIELKPKERIKSIDYDHKESLKKLIALSLFDIHEIIGTKKRPRGVKTKVQFNTLSALEELDFIDNIFIESIDYATKKDTIKADIERYFCVKMTVVIDIEGITPKKQKIEKRFVLIKARSAEDAYEKLDRQKHKYTEPYLNPDGRFVSWRIDSFDDCYETDIITPNDIDDPKGVEVYSKLSWRKSNKKKSQ